MSQAASGPHSPVVPDPDDVDDFYDRNNRVLTELFGGSIHYGYWHGPNDISGLEVAGARMTDEVLDRLDVQPGMKVLDLGCGTGGPGVRLAKWSDADITGISVSAQDVALASQRARDEGVADRIRFQQANATRMPFEDGTFDRVLALESVVHITDRVRALKEIARVLKPGGRVVLTDYIVLGPEIEDEDKRAATAQILSAMRTAPMVRADAYPGFLAAAGLTAVEITDITEHTKYTLGRLHLAMAAHSREHGALPPELKLVHDMCEGIDWVEYAQQPQTDGVVLVVGQIPPARD
ncbi:cyclopropane-fatty-acyl-phospholipid synthase family protein [Streptomyces sp. AK010]|uniref:SAM-dependent methyltransferase n=1 Tax=Streptomyces sp. AK010 TaxID=2723074 RepID=UPI00160FD5D3|nr:methyltransferase domain-containing protein [Streptomyces sp. AK010]MBB6421397.1 cyclopropane fatty-acyl-phospholipid synthase-like methyltransferase [Streptomyces sp. AK010]